MKTVWIVDGSYLYNFGKTRANGVDYLKLKNELERISNTKIHESYYLNSTQDPNNDAQNAFHTWIKSAPPKGPKMRVQLYRLKNVHQRCPNCKSEFDRQVQKGVDVGIATLIIKLAAKNTYDRLILTAGDGDFEDAISYVKSDLNKEIWMNGAQDTLSSDLQSYSDNVIWLDDLIPQIEK